MLEVVSPEKLSKLIGAVYYCVLDRSHWELSEADVIFFFQAEDGIRDADVTGVQTCALPIFIARGRKLVDGALSDIKRIHGGHHLVIGFDGSAGAAQQVFADRLLVKKVDDYGQFAELELAAGADAQVILQRLVASGARLSRFELMEPSLNKIFIDLVGPEAARAVMRPEGEAARA